MGLLYVQDHRYGEALAAFKKYLALGEGDPASLHEAQERVRSLEAAAGKK
jgi:hypothetical protein